MLTDLLMNAGLVLAEAVWGLVPQWNVTIPNQVADLVGEFSKWDAFVPFSEMMQIGQLVGTLVSALIAWRVLSWVFQRILDIIPT